MYTFSAELRESYEKLTIPIIFATSDKNGNMIPVLISDGLLSYMGATREALQKIDDFKVISRFFEKIHPDEVSKLRSICDDFIMKQTDFDIIFRGRISGVYHPIHGVGYWQVMPDGSKMALIVFADMERHKSVIEELVKKYVLFQKDDFYTDVLTDLPNINYLNKFGEGKMQDILGNGEIPVVVYFDVESMQSYNNKYGFKRGDQLLILIANILATEFPHGLVIRAADDHYIVVDSYKGRDQLSKKLEKINTRVKNEAFGTTTGLLAGIYVCGQKDSLTESIDHAIRANKLIGVDLNTAYRFYTYEDDVLYRHQRYVIENFYKALNNGWIKVYYQCFLRLETGSGMGFEALARWHDPVKGIINPSEFIPPLEKYHLMHEMDLYIFEQVCREIKPRYEAGLPLLPISVNFSRQDFDYIDVVGEINRIVDKYHIEQYGIDKSYFFIEITEQGLAKATDKFLDQLSAIRESGYKLWVDDFGSGYSSLNVFSMFDIDLIKFDMELLRNLDARGGANRVILKGMVDVAHKLGIHTLCEGMETPEQKQFLLDIGCELAQGFLYHKPEGLDTIFERLNIGIPIPKCETTEERIELEKRWRID